MPGRPKQPKQDAPNWGGARDGAGRPTERNGKANVLITVRLTQEERDELMKKHALPGESHNKLVKRLLRELVK